MAKRDVTHKRAGLAQGGFYGLQAMSGDKPIGWASQSMAGKNMPQYFLTKAEASKAEFSANQSSLKKPGVFYRVGVMDKATVSKLFR